VQLKTVLGLQYDLQAAAKKASVQICQKLQKSVLKSPVADCNDRLVEIRTA
jgi:hypothetical protein